MSSHYSFDIIRHKNPESKVLIRSHVLHPHSDITIICIISAERENVVSVLEDHLLESVSSTGWNEGEENADFSYVTEKYNHFLGNLAQSDLIGTGALFATLIRDSLMVSTLWWMCAILCEKDGEISIVAEERDEEKEFQSISTGTIPHKGNVFFCSKPLNAFLGDDFFDECSHMKSEVFRETIEGLLIRDHRDSLDIIRILQEHTSPEKWTSHITRSRKVNHQIDIARWYLFDIFESLLHNRKIEVFFERIRVFLGTKNSQILIFFLITGAILFFLLISVLIKALFQVSNSPQVDIKNQILEAQNLIEQSQKLTSNSEAFNQNIHTAENILFKIRDKQEYMKDTQELLQRIEAMKKEMYDIQTIDLKKRTSILKFNPLDISPIWIFEMGNKLNLIGKNSAIFGYIQWSTVPNASPYPPWEEAISVDVTDDGNFYFLTKNKRVLSTKRNEVTYVSVTGQDSWENAEKVKTFNNNIYLVDSDWWQVYKHKPGVNWFSQKTPVLSRTLSWILDIGIDGWFYVVTDEPRIYRMITKDGFSQSGITLNKVPGEYSLGNEVAWTSLIVRPNLNFIYILSKDRIWIFEPDSKRFQDVRSWTYVAQLEISSDENIRSISIPRDGLIYIVTNLWVYSIPFDFIDRNIILKN